MCVVAQEVALSYAPAFWVICFYLRFLKKEKKEKKVSPSPLPPPPPPKTTCQNQILPKYVTALREEGPPLLPLPPALLWRAESGR